ncbi:MAG: hypothetical protein ACOY93_02170 [Bacillota bacterium]
MPPYKLARLSDEQMMMLEALENEIGVTLVAYEPACDGLRDAATQRLDQGEAQEDLMTDALLDTYRTYDPPV